MLWTLTTPLRISPIFKVPLLFVNAVSIHVCYTAPQPIAEEEETGKYGYTVNSKLRFQLIRGLANCTKTLQWMYSASESVVLLANTFPWAIPGEVMSTLMRYPGNVSALRITPTWLIGSALIASGGYVREICYRELGRFFTWELSLKRDQNLITTGPYSIVRHPGYTGNWLVLIGAFLCQIGPGTWMTESGWFEMRSVRVLNVAMLAHMTIISCSMVRRTYMEDQVLKERFPEEWCAWVRRTPYKLIPYIF